MHLAPSRRPAAWSALLLLAAPALGASESAASEARPPEPDDPPLFTEDLDVKERGDALVGVALSASEGMVGIADLERRPILRPGDVAETVPGLVATQHSGGGKANQFFVRGFNLDHGTDFALSVGGIPVNMPTHGHGQGYADLNFVIPETIGRAHFRKGPYWAEVGDFSGAGSLDLELRRTMPRTVQLTGGSFDFGRALYADTFQVGDETSPDDLLVAFVGFHDDGPWTRGDDYDGGKALLRWSRGDSTRGISVTGLGYDATWLSTDQVPRRAVDSGQIGRFDLLDESPRGTTSRFSLSAEAHRTRGSTLDRVHVWAKSYDFSLVSNFTYLLGDPERGDEFTQLDDRNSFGGDVSRHWHFDLGEMPLALTVGADLRYDDIGNALLLSEDTVPFQTVRRDDVELFGGGVHGQARLRLTDWLQLSAGLRLHGYDATVTSDLALNSGDISDELVLPNVSLSFGPWNDTELYVNVGRGMHSNDARGAVVQVDPLSLERAERSPPLVRTEGIDLGVRSVALPGLQTTLTLFQLDLDSELVFVGDAGGTEAGRPSRRQGVEWMNHFERGPWTVELDLTLTDAEFRDDDPAGPEIPGSVGRTVSAGITWDDDTSRLHGGLQWRYFGDVPLIEDGSQVWSSSQTLNGRLGLRVSEHFDLVLDVFNLLDSEQSDIEYFYASRLPGEPAAGIEDVHFHPVIRRAARLTLRWTP